MAGQRQLGAWSEETQARGGLCRGGDEHRLGKMHVTRDDLHLRSRQAGRVGHHRGRVARVRPVRERVNDKDVAPDFRHGYGLRAEYSRRRWTVDRLGTPRVKRRERSRLSIVCRTMASWMLAHSSSLRGRQSRSSQPLPFWLALRTWFMARSSPFLTLFL